MGTKSKVSSSSGRPGAQRHRDRAGERAPHAGPVGGSQSPSGSAASAPPIPAAAGVLFCWQAPWPACPRTAAGFAAALRGEGDGEAALGRRAFANASDRGALPSSAPPPQPCAPTEAEAAGEKSNDNSPPRASACARVPLRARPPLHAPLRLSSATKARTRLLSGGGCGSLARTCSRTMYS